MENIQVAEPFLISPKSLCDLSISAYILGLLEGNLPPDEGMFEYLPLSVTGAILHEMNIVPVLKPYVMEILSKNNRFLKMCNRAEMHPLLQCTINSLVVHDNNTIKTLHTIFTNTLWDRKNKFLFNDPATGDQEFVDYINQGMRFSAFLLDAFWVPQALSFISSIRNVMCSIPYGNYFHLLWLRVLLQLLTIQNANMRLIDANETARNIKSVLSDFDSRSEEAFAEIPASLYAKLYQQMLLTYVKLDNIEACDVQYANVLRVLDDTVPPQIVVDCLSTVAKYCIAKGKNQAGYLMFSQAINLAQKVFDGQSNKYVALLVDYADSLLNMRLTMVALSVYTLAINIVNVGGRRSILMGLILLKAAYCLQLIEEYDLAYIQTFRYTHVGGRLVPELLPFDWITLPLIELYQMTDEVRVAERTADLNLLVEHLEALMVGDFSDQVPEDVFRVLAMMALYHDAAIKSRYILPTILRLERECKNQQHVKKRLSDYGLPNASIGTGNLMLLFNGFRVSSSVIPLGELKRQLSEAGLVAEVPAEVPAEPAPVSHPSEDLLRKEDALDELIWHLSGFGMMDDVPEELELSSRRNPDMPPLRIPFRFML